MTLKNSMLKLFIIALMLLLGTAFVQAQDDVTPGDSPTALSTAIDSVEQPSTPINSGTQSNANPPAQASPIEQALANLINNIPMMFVYGVVSVLCIYLIRERKEMTRLLAGAVGPDMATTLMDTFVKGALSALQTAARAFPGKADDKQVDELAREAGLIYGRKPDGTYGWLPIEGPDTSGITAQAALTDDDFFQKLAALRGLKLSKSQQVDGSTAYTLITTGAG
jgi:hypothetical protein